MVHLPVKRTWFSIALKQFTRAPRRDCDLHLVIRPKHELGGPKIILAIGWHIETPVLLVEIVVEILVEILAEFLVDMLKYWNIERLDVPIIDFGIPNVK